LTKLSNARFTIVGNGPEEARLRADVFAYKVKDSVDFMSRLPQNRLFDLYESHDLLIFPSLHDSGGFVVLEALSHGMPVVCLALGGPKDIVTANSGVIINTTGLDTAQVASRMAAELTDLFASPTRVAALSAGAISRATEFLLPNRVAKFYEEALKFIEAEKGDSVSERRVDKAERRSNFGYPQGQVAHALEERQSRAPATRTISSDSNLPCSKSPVRKGSEH